MVFVRYGLTIVIKAAFTHSTIILKRFIHFKAIAGWRIIGIVVGTV